MFSLNYLFQLFPGPTGTYAKNTDEGKERFYFVFDKKIQALLFVTLETLDSYADTSTLISEIKKASSM